MLLPRQCVYSCYKHELSQTKLVDSRTIRCCLSFDKKLERSIREPVILSNKVVFPAYSEIVHSFFKCSLPPQFTLIYSKL